LSYLVIHEVPQSQNIVCMRIVLPCHSWSTTEPEHRVYENCLTLSFMKYHRARTTIFPISNSITIIAYWNKKKMLSSTIYTEPAGNVSYSQETISSTLSRLYYLCNSCLETPITNPNSNQQLSWILPITYF
jgi:hypothetical protein